MYEEAFTQLDKSISLLSELKTLTTRYENIQMLNVQIDSIDRKKRSVAIKRSESIKVRFLFVLFVGVGHVVTLFILLVFEEKAWKL